MQSSAVQTAMMYDIPLEVNQLLLREKEQKFLIKKVLITKSVTGVAYSKDDAKITITSVEDRPESLPIYLNL